MEHFVKWYEDRIKGIISGFDRILFRGILRGISYPEGLGKLMSSHCSTGCLISCQKNKKFRICFTEDCVEADLNFYSQD